jgi:hypothetical protein
MKKREPMVIETTLIESRVDENGRGVTEETVREIANSLGLRIERMPDGRIKAKAELLRVHQ